MYKSIYFLNSINYLLKNIEHISPKNFERLKFMQQKYHNFIFHELQLIKILFLIGDSYVSWSTLRIPLLYFWYVIIRVSKSLRGIFHLSFHFVFNNSYMYFFNKKHGHFEFKKFNSFQNFQYFYFLSKLKKTRKAIYTLAPRPLIFKLQ